MLQLLLITSKVYFGGVMLLSYYLTSVRHDSIFMQEVMKFLLFLG